MSQSIKENEFASDKNFVDITKFQDGGVKKKILKSGSGPKPTEFAECEIQYIGYFTNGKVFANTFREYEKSVTFVMKKNKVIYGWEIACMSMKKGEKSRFKISSAYAYGANGLPPNIPPDTNLVFDIELVEWKSLTNRRDKFMEKTNQSYEELLRGAEVEKDAGNEFFKDGEYDSAIERFQEAIQYARFVYEPRLRVTTRPLMLACELNKAFCYLRMRKWRDAIKACDEALKLDAHEPKAFFRKAVAFRMMGQDAEAKKNILQAKRLCADDPGIDREITLIEWQWDQRKKREKKIFENLFDESKEAELSETPESALMQARPIKFKEDQQRLAKIDHVTLRGEDDALSKWGGGGDAPVALPKGDFRIPVDEEEEGAKKKNDDDDELPPPLESLSRVVPKTSSAPKVPVEESVAQKKAETAKVEKKVEAVAPKKAEAAVQKVAEPAKKAVVQKAEPAAKQAVVQKAEPAKQVEADDEYVYDNSMTNEKNPLVYFNFLVGGEPAGKVIVELFADRAPKTVQQFRKLCEKGYAGTNMTRFVHNYLLQGGDVGPSSSVKFGAMIERPDIPLNSEGLVCLAGAGSTQFFFTLVDCSHLNGQFAVIGKVVEGIEVLLEDFEEIEVDDSDVPRKKISIKSCGDFDPDM